ncbi:unnamed protein product [Caenorhabditis sp. 36 PRJEB53466]|nr:unnamed protein product [Caenorhabditis sp. 36 PRJEB53466]
MEQFVEQLNVLKRMFDQLPSEDLQEAIDRIDHTVEQMAQSVIFVPSSQVECLAESGLSVVQDFLDAGSSFSSVHHQDEQMIDFTCSADEMYCSEDALEQPEHQNLSYCFTCGEEFNNRKAQYRHGKLTEHQTRPPKNRDEEKARNRRKKEKEEAEKAEKREEETEDLMENIVEEKKKKQVKILFCHECKEGFANRKGLYRHSQKTNHLVRLKRAEQSKGGPIECAECAYTTANEANLRRHLQRFHNIKCLK